jgi:lipid-A-disaccharide synthase
VVETKKSALSKTTFLQKLGLSEDDLCIGLFLGSRERELKVMAPIFLETLMALHESYPDAKIIVPTLPHLEFEVTHLVKNLPFAVYVVCDPKWKWQSFSACTVALAVSGTVGLELAYAGVPHIIGYKMNAITAFVLKFLMKIKNAHLANILLGRTVVPECIQGRCTSLNLSREMLFLIRDKDRREAQKKEFQVLREQLMPEQSKAPSRKAAEFVLGVLQP